jgi:hypothetical protein
LGGLFFCAQVYQAAALKVPLVDCSIQSVDDIGMRAVTKYYAVFLEETDTINKFIDTWPPP